MNEYKVNSTNQAKIFGSDKKKILEQCLKIRNTSGHPNEAVIGKQVVLSHVQILIDNVYKKYI